MNGDPIHSLGIVGGGIAGLSAAWFGLLAGWSVDLFEPEMASEPAGGRQCASWAAAGMLAPVHELEFQETDLLTCGLEALRLWHEWFRLPAFAHLAYPVGGYEVTLTPADTPWLRRQFEFQQSQGLAVEWLEQRTLRQALPALHPSITAAIYNRLDCQTDPRIALQTLQRLCSQHPRFRLCTQPIVERSPLHPHVVLRTCSGESYEYDQVVVATGCREGQPLALPYAIKPIKGLMAALRPDPQVPTPANIIRYRSQRHGTGYYAPKRERIIIGTTSEDRGFDRTLSLGGLTSVFQKALTVLPALSELGVVEHWAGFRPSTPDLKPILCWEPEAQTLHINGLYRHGILLGPYLAQAAIRFLHTHEWPEVVRPFVRLT
jgi:glycine oxidase